MWRLTMQRYPGCKDAKDAENSLNALLPRVLKRAAAARSVGKTLLTEEQWYRFYMNPFELMNAPRDMDLDDFDAKTVQRLKKALLAEIELEDGQLSWMLGLIIDKSRAISVCEEISDYDKSLRHWQIYQNKNLLAFLERGSHDHFLVDETDSPLATIDIFEDDSGFRTFISEPFARQFDLVLSEAISQQNLAIIECLLDGRRWVDPPFDDMCFENAHRLVDRMLEKVRGLPGEAEVRKLSAQEVASRIADNKIDSILNLFPTYLWNQQNEAISIIRTTAAKAWQAHHDIDLAKATIQVANRFSHRTAAMASALDADLKDIEEIIHKERAKEVKLTSGDDTWAISREGVTCGKVFIPADDVGAIRWGTIIQRQQTGNIKYDYLMVFRSKAGREVKFSWVSSDYEVSNKHFGNLIDAAVQYLLPPLAERMIETLRNANAVWIGPVQVMENGVQFETRGWLFSDTTFVPWNRFQYDIKNGDITVSDKEARKTKILIPFRDTDNAPLLKFLAFALTKSED